jgi:hypothetical protein
VRISMISWELGMFMFNSGKSDFGLQSKTNKQLCADPFFLIFSHIDSNVLDLKIHIKIIKICNIKTQKLLKSQTSNKLVNGHLSWYSAGPEKPSSEPLAVSDLGPSTAK